MKKTAEYRMDRPLADHQAKVSQGSAAAKNHTAQLRSNQDQVTEDLLSHLKCQKWDKI